LLSLTNRTSSDEDLLESSSANADGLRDACYSSLLFMGYVKKTYCFSGRPSLNAQGKVQCLSHSVVYVGLTNNVRTSAIACWKVRYNYLVVTIELFLIVLTAEAIYAKICQSWRFSVLADILGKGRCATLLNVVRTFKKLEGLPLHLVLKYW